MTKRIGRLPFLTAVLAGTISTSTFAAPPTDLLISEYIEGGSTRKGIEIYNGTGSAIDLSGYEVHLFSNGSPTSSASVTLSGMLADGDVFTLCSSLLDTTAGPCDLISGSVANWNGDDAISLNAVSDGAVVDSFGQRGSDPGTEWANGGVSTLNMTLVRMDTVCAGDTIDNDAFDPSVEWTGFPQDTFTNFGSHTANCGAVIDNPPTVDSTTPADTATDVALDSDISITFNEEVTITGIAAFAINCSVSGPVAFAITSPSPSTDPATSYTLDPTSDFANSETCTVTVAGDEVSDTDGTPQFMAADEDFSFTTVAPPPANPVVSITTLTVEQAEGNSPDTSNFVFTLDITPAPTSDVTFTATIDSSGTNPANAADMGTALPFAFPFPVLFNASSTPPYQISIPVNGDDVYEQDETFTLTLSDFSGTDASQTSPLTATGTIQNDDRVPVPVVQGAGPCSPFVTPCSLTTNTSATMVDIATAVVTAIGPDGFAMQDPVGDGDDTTSDGVWVFTFGSNQTDSAEPLAVGDLVQVTGGVKEYYGFTEVQVSSTRDPGNSILRTAQDQPLPAAIEFSDAQNAPSEDPEMLSCPNSGPNSMDPLNADTNFECWEGMLVNITSGMTTTGNDGFSGDLYEEVGINPRGGRAYREKGVKLTDPLVPGAEGAGMWDGDPEIMEMDAERLGAFPTDFEIVGGVPFSGQGIVGFERGDYEFWPAGGEYPIGNPRFALDPADNVLPRPVADPVGGDPANELRIGSFNTWRLCDIIDDVGQPGGGPNGYNIEFDCDSSGIEAGGQPAYDLKIQKISAYINTVLRNPDVVGLQEVEKLSILNDLVARISTDGGPAYTPYLVEGNDPGGIDVAYLVRDDRIQNAVVQQLHGTTMWDDPSDGTTALHDRPPLMLTAEFVPSAGGRSFKFATLNVHNRSFGSNDRVYAKRFMQAQDIAGIVQAYQTDSGNADQPLLVLGDFNAYQFSDGHTDPVGLISGTYDNTENECSPSNTVTDCNLPESTPGTTDQVVDPPLLKHVDVLSLTDPNEVYSYTYSENFGAIFGYQTAPGDTAREVAANQVIDHLLLTAPIQALLAEFQYGRANVDASYNGVLTGSGPDGMGSTHNDPAIGSSDHDGFVATFSLDCALNPAADGDGDGICDLVDNCPTQGNNDQTDANDNGLGAACDATPVAADDPSSGSYAATEDTMFSVPAAGLLTNDTDADGDILNATLVDDSLASGTVTVNADGSFGYTPNLDFCDDTNPVSFSYSATDGETTSGAATASILVSCVNDAPVISDIASPQMTDEEVSVMVAFTITDVDSTLDCSAADLTATSSNGALMPVGDIVFDGTAPNCTATLTPALDQVGNSTIRITVSDGTLEAFDEFVLMVSNIDDPAVLSDDTATVTEDDPATAIDVLANDSDPDSPLSITDLTQPANGSVIATGGGTGLTYEPDANYCNDGGDTDDFTYTANGLTANVAVTVSCVDDDAVAASDSATVAQNSSANLIAVLDNDTPDPDFALSIDSVDATSVEGGSVSIDGSQISYTPLSGFCGGTDTFDYTLAGGSSATVTVTVDCLPDDIFADGFED